MIKKAFPFLVLLVVVLACSEDEPEVLTNDPLVDLQLFNIDSLITVNDSLLVVTDSLKVLQDSLLVLNDSSTVLMDSIAVLEILIVGGQNYLEDEKTLLEGILESFTAIIETLDDHESSIQQSESTLSSIASNIESGNVLISIVENALNNQVINYSDSMTVYELPLSMTADSSVFNLYVSDMIFSLTIGYTRAQNLNEEENIEIQTSDFRILRHTADSVIVNCKNSACIDEDTVIELYF